MNNNSTVVRSAEPESRESGPSTLEVIVGLLALVLVLAAVVVAIAQLHQSRAAKHRHRQPDPESGQTSMEMSNIPDNGSSSTDSVRSNRSVDVAGDNIPGP